MDGLVGASQCASRLSVAQIGAPLAVSLGCRSMQAVPHLEDYIRTARVLHAGPLAGGGGHQYKQLLILDGGLGVAAKLAEPDPIASQRVRAEVAAWLLVRELGWTDLVPTTALRAVRSIHSGNDVAASVQIAWPFFELAAESQPPKTPGDCPDADTWRVAIFDALCSNPDRNDTNWGCVRGFDQPKLIDHGHAFDPNQASTSPFVAARRGQAIPAEYVDRLRRLVGRQRETSLRDVLEEASVDSIIQRAKTFIDTGNLDV
jgi:hypothetical protein